MTQLLSPFEVDPNRQKIYKILRMFYRGEMNIEEVVDEFIKIIDENDKK